MYSEVDSLSCFIHDSSNLRIVYETLQFNWYDSAQVQDQQIEEAVQRYQSTLQVLASGKRTGLTAREKKVLALWGKQVSAATLQAAAERIRFQRGQKDRIRDGIVRAGAWENRIRRMLRDAGLPEQLAALPHVESSYNPYVESHAGAVGLWQFTLFTGRHYLRVDNVVDERVDPVKATDGAVRLLGLPPRERALVREVTLQLGETPVVFARSVFPYRSLTGSLAHLRRLQNRSLGAILFSNAGMRRSPFELAHMPGDSDYLPRAQRQDGRAWGRRCRFEIEGKSLLVSEVFLEKFTPWSAPLPVHRTQRGIVSAAIVPPTK